MATTSRRVFAAAALLVGRLVRSDELHASRSLLEPRFSFFNGADETDASSTRLGSGAGRRPLPFSDASTPLAGEQLLSASHFFLHVPKTGGESFALFIEAGLPPGFIPRFRSPPLELPPPCYRPLHTLLCRKRNCNVTARSEGTCLAASEAVLPTVVLSSEVPLLSMVRKPEDHVLSMYAQCQQPGSDGQTAAYQFPPISIQEWVKLAARTANSSTEESRLELLKHCYYDPRDLQVAVLGNGLADAVRNVRAAMWVGVTEYMDASICLLLSLFQKKAVCDCETGLRLSIPKDAHGTNTGAYRPLLGELKPFIDSITEDDKVLHSHAKDKLREGLNSFGLGCLMQREQSVTF